MKMSYKVTTQVSFLLDQEKSVCVLFLTDSFVCKKLALTKDLLTTSLESQVLHVYLNSHAVKTQGHLTIF